MKNLKKAQGLFVGLATFGLVFGSSYAARTLAYLTDTEGATNTFTVGKVRVDLTEDKYPGNGDPKTEDLVPNQEVDKNPQVKNTGTNDAIVFMTVQVPRASVTVVGADGTKTEKKLTDLFWMKQTDDSQATFANNFNVGADGKWIELTNKENTDTNTNTSTTSTYVFAYKEKVAKDATTEALFDKVQLKNVIESEIDSSTQNIVVNTYAIQASEVLGSDSADYTDTLDQTNLEKIYDIYFNQNQDQDTSSVKKEADTNNALNLKAQDRA